MEDGRSRRGTVRCFFAIFHPRSSILDFQRLFTPEEATSYGNR